MENYYQTSGGTLKNKKTVEVPPLVTLFKVTLPFAVIEAGKQIGASCEEKNIFIFSDS